jgi:transforming growth factor-beta-induced protein
MKTITNTFKSFVLRVKAWIFSIVLVSSQVVSAQTVVDIIVGSPDHTTLEAAVLAAELDGTLSGEGPFTVFAPTDAAFAALPEGTVEALLADIPALTAILTYHVVGSTALSGDLSDKQKIVTLNGKKVTITIDEMGVKINGVAMVVAADLLADNGVVHVIDAVLLPPPATVADIVVSSPDHNTLEAALGAAGLVGTLSGDGPFTVFAPTDAAFAALPEGTVEALLADIPTLTAILTYHVVGAEAWSGDLSNKQKIVTLNGKKVTITIDEMGVKINGVAMVVAADILANNGVVHVIDAVLLPPPATVADIVVSSPDHNTLEAALGAAGLVGTLSGDGPFTVFAPTDAAFAALPEGTVEALLADIPTLTAILTYHVVGAEAWSGDLSNKQKIVTLNGKKVTITIDEMGVKINGVAMVVAADILANNGVVHVIDAVLLPPPATVADIVVSSPDHNTLEAALGAAGLVGTLSGDGPFTVFAPTDAAFAALPEGTVEALLADIPTLTAILTYHVVGAEAWSGDLSNKQKIVTLNGKKVTITIDEMGVKINGVAMVVAADILANNGVVHVIDAVLLPPPATVADIVVSSPDHNTLEAALGAAGLVGTLSGDGPFTVFAPTDAAFAALPEGTVEALLADIPTLTAILTYHVVGAEAWSGDLSNKQKIVTLNGKKVTITIDEMGVKINGVAMVVAADILADNGVVHVLDAVLLPPPATVADIVVSSPDHNTLEAALGAAGLVGTLSGDGPFTVFAPTDAAFAALPEGTVEALLADIPTLTAILTYHVVGAEAWSGDLSDGMEIETLNGKKVTITIGEMGVKINDVAMVIAADILADNGVVHVIDAVLIPETTNIGSNLLERGSKLKVYPNPASSQINLSFSLKKAGRVSMEIFNGSGQRVDYTSLGTLQEGVHGFNKPISNLGNGLYMVVITTETERVVSKLKVVR